MEPRLDYRKFSPEALQALRSLEQYIAGCGLDHKFLHLLKLRASQINGCAFCIDMHWRDLVKLDVDPRHLNALAGWREAPFFTDRERAALNWAEAVTSRSHHATNDDEFAKLKNDFSDEEIAELGFVIANINAWNLLNLGFRNPVPERA